MSTTQNFIMWLSKRDDDLFCAIKEGVNYEVYAINDGPSDDPDVVISSVHLITEDEDAIEVGEYPKEIEDWLFDHFYEMSALDPEEQGWETNRFKETL